MVTWCVAQAAAGDPVSKSMGAIGMISYRV
jgi:hypothetical protein